MPGALSPSIQVQGRPSSSSSVTNRNTGFPEPFNHERNTTLTHPDADTSVDASIEEPEVSVARTHSRKISFLSHRSKHSNASGKIDPADLLNPTATEALYSNIQYADGSKEDRDVKEVEQREDMLAVPGDVERDEQGYSPGERKKGMLRKMNLHKV